MLGDHDHDLPGASLLMSKKCTSVSPGAGLLAAMLLASLSTNEYKIVVFLAVRENRYGGLPRAASPALVVFMRFIYPFPPLRIHKYLVSNPRSLIYNRCFTALSY